MSRLVTYSELETILDTEGWVLRKGPMFPTIVDGEKAVCHVAVRKGDPDKRFANFSQEMKGLYQIQSDNPYWPVRELLCEEYAEDEVPLYNLSVLFKTMLSGDDPKKIAQEFLDAQRLFSILETRGLDRKTFGDIITKMYPNFGKWVTDGADCTQIVCRQPDSELDECIAFCCAESNGKILDFSGKVRQRLNGSLGRPMVKVYTKEE